MYGEEPMDSEVIRDRDRTESWKKCWKEERTALEAQCVEFRIALHEILAMNQNGDAINETGRIARTILDSTSLGDDILAQQSQLREGIAWCYQFAGAIGQPVEVLDNLSALAQGQKPPHDWKAASCDLEAQLAEAVIKRDDMKRSADCVDEQYEAALDVGEKQAIQIIGLTASLEISHRQYLSEISILQAQLAEARRLLWLRHGCPLSALYGDDGEMQCGRCIIDFKRNSIEDIVARFQRMNLEALAKSQSAESKQEKAG